MTESFLTFPLLLKAAPVLIQVSSKLVKHLGATDNKLFNELIELTIDKGADASQEKLEAALRQKPAVTLTSHAQVFMDYTGWVLGELIHHLAQQPQFADQKKDLEVFAEQAPAGWITFVRLGSPGLTPLHQDVFLRQMAAALARGDDLPPTDNVPFKVFFSWHIRLPAAVQEKLATHLQKHLDNALHLLLLNDDQKATQAYKQIILSGINGIHASLQSLHQKIDVTVETHQLVKDGQQETHSILGQLLNIANSTSADSRLSAYLNSLLAAFSAYQELALDNYAAGDQTNPNIWDIFVHPACSVSHLRPEDMDAAQLEKPPRLPALDLLPILGSETDRRHVLLADPGMGKSTLIQALIVHLASGCALPGAPTLSGLLPVPLILRDLVPLLPQDQPDSWTWDCLITVFLKQYQRKATAPSLCEAYKNHAAEFRQLIQRSDRVFFLIDGLDEIGDLAKRQRIVRAIQEGIRIADKKSRWLITSRVTGYDESPVDEVLWSDKDLSYFAEFRRHPRLVNRSEIETIWTEYAQPWKDLYIQTGTDPLFSPIQWGLKDHALSAEVHTHGSNLPQLFNGFHRIPIARRFYLAPFDDQRQEHFTSLWFRLRRVPDYTEELMRELRRPAAHGVRIISRVPNLLCFMSILKRSGKPLPDGRAALYAEIAKAYLYSIDTSYRLSAVHGHDCPFDFKARVEILAYIAILLQRQRYTEIKVRQDVKEVDCEAKSPANEAGILFTLSQFEFRVTQKIKQMQGQGRVTDEETPTKLLADLLDHISRRSGLLIPRGVDAEGNSLFGFTHLSFLEYFAAVSLDGEFQRQRNRLARRAEAVGDGDTLSEEDLERECPSCFPISYEKSDFGDLAENSVWHEVLIFLVEMNASCPDMLLRWLLPLLRPSGQQPTLAISQSVQSLMTVNSVSLAVKLAYDRELSLPEETRRRWWRTIWRARLLWPLSPGEMENPARWHTAPELLRREDSQLEIMQELAAAIREITRDGIIDAGNQTPKLRHPVWLYDCDTLTTAAVAQLTGLQGVERLDLSGCTALESVPDLSGLEDLKALNLRGCTGLKGAAAFDDLAVLQTLEELSLDGLTALESVPDLNGLVGLKTLSLRGCTSLKSDGAFEGIAVLHGLEVLILDGCTALKSVPDLRNMAGLRMLTLRYCTGLRGAEAFETLYALHGLEVLWLTGCTGLTDEAVALLREKIQLTRRQYGGECKIYGP